MQKWLTFQIFLFFFFAFKSGLLTSFLSSKLRRIFCLVGLNLLHLGLTPCRGGEACVSQMTQRAVSAGTVVPGRSNHAGLVKG